jgi:DNA (cytosine-5)-methyltransferase 1
MTPYTAIELCAGGGGQAIGLEKAGFTHLACVEYESDFCKTLQFNRPKWNVICQDIRNIDGKKLPKCDLLAGGVPCPPFSIAGKQLGEQDERDMFPAMLNLIEQINPRGVMIENVKGLMSDKFKIYRDKIVMELQKHGFVVDYRILEASGYGVPQLRPRFLLIALKPNDKKNFEWPLPDEKKITVGEALFDLLAEKGWHGAEQIRMKANSVAPTIVGGSKKHGGPDLGPTRAREQWKKLGIDGKGLADSAPDAEMASDDLPKITVRMAARIQGFPDDWIFYGGKTTQYRQVGNAFPPPVAYAIGKQIVSAYKKADNEK